ncbi:tigger transposable element-derived protein [Elysia marginata]|uniref:Tigger transposable element-derived protein n=1 Tax=Elysia marginata TaxID=1093978 RepID=A0AAV4GKG5_9GAST|nr:tigger transposable element-derived protein [Elysia marginata]
MDKFKFSPSEIYNTDETGCTTVQNPGAVVTEKGKKKQVGAKTSAERGELVTVAYTVSAIGSVVPPLFIFPRVHYRDHFIRGAPTQCIGSATRSGWMNEEVFVDYLKHIIQHTRCSPENKILLILDNHDTHICLSAVDTARSHGVELLTIPPHTSHRVQPLDRSVYGPFKTAYNRAMDGWLRSNPGKTVTIYHIPALVNQAQMTAITPANITHLTAGFQATGIHPFNRDIFSETFLLSRLTSS